MRTNNNCIILHNNIIIYVLTIQLRRKAYTIYISYNTFSSITWVILYYYIARDEIKNSPVLNNQLYYNNTCTIEIKTSSYSIAYYLFESRV